MWALAMAGLAIYILMLLAPIILLYWPSLPVDEDNYEEDEYDDFREFNFDDE